MPAGVSRAAMSSPTTDPSAAPHPATWNHTVPPQHVGSHSRYSAGCRCAACTAAHADYLGDWRAGRIHRSADTAPVGEHLQRLVDSGLVLAYLADEAGSRAARCTGSGTAPGGLTGDGGGAARAAPAGVCDALPSGVRDRDSLNVTGGNPRRQRSAAVADLDLRRRPLRELASGLAVSARTVQRWRSAQVSPVGAVRRGR